MPKTKPLKKNRTNDGAFFIYHAPDLDEIYLDLSSQPEWERIEALLNERRYTVKDTDISYRTINHWTEEGLLDDDRAGAVGWRKLSFKDLAWLRILRDLRKFGFSLDKLRETFATLIPARSIEFETAIALCLRTPATPVFIVVFDDGTADAATLHSLRITDYMVGFEVPFIRLNLNAICCEILNQPSLMPPRTFSLEMIDTERQIIEALRSSKDSVDEVRLRLKDGEASEIQNIKGHKGLPPLADLIHDINFGEIVIKVQDGKPVYTSAAKKKKIKE